MYDMLIERRLFQEAAFPIVQEYRRRQQRQQQQHSPLPPSPLSRPSGFINTRYECSSPSTSPALSVNIASASPEHSNTDNSIEDPPTTFHTPINEEEGTQDRPIDVDTFVLTHTIHLPRQTLVQQFTTRRTRSIDSPTHCDMCGHFGHLACNCIWNGPIICDYCREVGHLRNNCPENRRDIAAYNPQYQFCLVCNQPGHTLDRCFALLHMQ
jgi:hypothetical protein